MNTEDLLIESAQQTKERLATRNEAPILASFHRSITRPVAKARSLTIETVKRKSEHLANLAVPTAAAFGEAVTNKPSLDHDDILIPAAEVAATLPANPEPSSVGV